MKPPPLKPLNPIDWALPLAFALGGALAAWFGFPRWHGLFWWFLTLISSFVLGAQLPRRRHE